MPVYHVKATYWNRTIEFDWNAASLAEVLVKANEEARVTFKDAQLPMDSYRRDVKILVKEK